MDSFILKPMHNLKFQENFFLSNRYEAIYFIITPFHVFYCIVFNMQHETYKHVKYDLYENSK